MFSNAPQPPYYAVIFTSLLNDNTEGYAEMAEQMLELAASQPGFLGVESVRGEDGLGITVSYWRNEQAIGAWKRNLEHQQAQTLGQQRWYRQYLVRVARVERDYGFSPDG